MDMGELCGLPSEDSPFVVDDDLEPLLEELPSRPAAGVDGVEGLLLSLGVSVGGAVDWLVGGLCASEGDSAGDPPPLAACH
ncbi:hypothetical protein AXF42_Ash010492 [Apostasia shenzhenica]|uniref:Uncharacterized protein n=1 Tax=Apostasia shenzhenica TaxID=1088818 RepID=A0A2I0BE82_9ASPA|nr:hypothetical protein AXF42_Ash010492 [Apostasia shenzhenica]